MTSATLDKILRLSVAQRMQLAEDIWESVAASPERVPVTEAQRKELDRRLQRHRAEPEAAIPWEKVRSRLRGRR